MFPTDTNAGSETDVRLLLLLKSRLVPTVWSELKLNDDAPVLERFRVFVTVTNNGAETVASAMQLLASNPPMLVRAGRLSEVNPVNPKLNVVRLVKVDRSIEVKAVAEVNTRVLSRTQFTKSTVVKRASVVQVSDVISGQLWQWIAVTLLTAKVRLNAPKGLTTVVSANPCREYTSNPS